MSDATDRAEAAMAAELERGFSEETGGSLKTYIVKDTKVVVSWHEVDATDSDDAVKKFQDYPDTYPAYEQECFPEETEAEQE